MLAALALAPTALRILFVGDSFTYFNNLPRLVQAIAERTPGARLRCERVTRSSWNLGRHLRAGLALARVRSFHPDVVVLQEEGTLPISDPARFQASARRFAAAIRATGARPGLLMTWAPRDKPWAQAPLSDATRRVGRALHVPVIPAGEAWRAWRALPGAPDLTVADGIHPDFLGSYLTALVVLGALRGGLPTRVPTSFGEALGVRHPDGATPFVAGVDPAALPRLIACARRALGDERSPRDVLTPPRLRAAASRKDGHPVDSSLP